MKKEKFKLSARERLLLYKIRSYYEDPNTGKFFNSKGQEFEQKFYEESLKRDP